MLQRIQNAQQSHSLLKKIWRTSIARFFLLLAVGACAVLVTRVEATVVPLIGLDRMVAEAELIVEGKVADVTSRWSENKTTIYTYVTLNNLRVVNGQVGGDTLTLRFEGGEVEGYRIAVDGMPSFDQGEQEFLFIRGNNVAVSPVVGFFQGRFKVVNGQIHDNVGTPIVEIRGNSFVKLSRQPGEPPTEGMTAGTPENRSFPYRPGTEERPAVSEPEHLPPQGGRGSKEPDTSQASASRIVHPPPADQAIPPTQGAPSATREPISIFLDPQQDPGRRLSVDEFINIIRGRLNR